MWRPAAFRFGLVALVACGGRAVQQPLENHGAPGRGSVVGAYACAIEDAGYRYPAFRCVIRQAGGKLELVKLDGSQRFEGEVRQAARGGLAFSGRFYCPFGDCTQALHGEFAPDGGGGWKGTFTDARFVVWMTPAAGGAYGGNGYGGQGYGGVGYGGAMVGAPPSN
ncbi:MAG: hypothetical protein JO257_37785 [Deltaproteobacteria bacterium]|nr:hypothetical protein [Deltaproteobacteria bacterium]